MRAIDGSLPARERGATGAGGKLLAILAAAGAIGCADSQRVIDPCDAMPLDGSNASDASDADGATSCGMAATAWPSGLSMRAREACEQWAMSRRPFSMPCAVAYGVVDDRGLCYAGDHCLDRAEYDECFCGDAGQCGGYEVCVAPLPGLELRCVTACSP